MASGAGSRYSALLAREAAFWDQAAKDSLAIGPPDWDFGFRIRSNVIAHGAEIRELLSWIHPGMDVLDLGCGPGWLTVAAARRGARAHGIDVAERAIEIAAQYRDALGSTLQGSATYEVADLNRIELPPEQYDLVLARGVFHHLLETQRLVTQAANTLRREGHIWASDPVGHVSTGAAILAGSLVLLLPTRVSYREKFGGLLRFGFRSPGRVRASMEAEGASPFEGAGRETDWPGILGRTFDVEWTRRHPAIVGYLADEVRMPDRLALPLLAAVRFFDRCLVRFGILQSSGLTVYARKPGTRTSP